VQVRQVAVFATLERRFAVDHRAEKVAIVAGILRIVSGCLQFMEKQFLAFDEL
jgi:hypothetical protein